MPINWDTKVKDSFTLVFLFLKGETLWEKGLVKIR